MFPLMVKELLAGFSCQLGPLDSPELFLQHVGEGLVYKNGPAQAA